MMRYAGYLLVWTFGMLALGGCASQSTNPRKPPQDLAKIAEINTQLAIAYMRDGENELALNKLLKAVEADPNYAAAYSTMGLLYNRVGEFAKADEGFRKALKIEPENSSILNNYGQILCQNGDHVKGQAMFLKAQENPLYRSPEITLTNAGTCAMEAGDLDGAETHFREALKVNPRIGQALLRMAMISFDLQRYLPARAYLQRYVEVGPHTAQSLWLWDKN